MQYSSLDFSFKIVPTLQGTKDFLKGDKVIFDIPELAVMSNPSSPVSCDTAFEVIDDSLSLIIPKTMLPNEVFTAKCHNIFLFDRVSNAKLVRDGALVTSISVVDNSFDFDYSKGFAASNPFTDPTPISFTADYARTVGEVLISASNVPAIRNTEVLTATLGTGYAVTPNAKCSINVPDFDVPNTIPDPEQVTVNAKGQLVLKYRPAQQILLLPSSKLRVKCSGVRLPAKPQERTFGSLSLGTRSHNFVGIAPIKPANLAAGATGTYAFPALVRGGKNQNIVFTPPQSSELDKYTFNAGDKLYVVLPDASLGITKSTEARKCSMGGVALATKALNRNSDEELELTIPRTMVLGAITCSGYDTLFSEIQSYDSFGWFASSVNVVFYSALGDALGLFTADFSEALSSFKDAVAADGTFVVNRAERTMTISIPVPANYNDEKVDSAIEGVIVTFDKGDAVSLFQSLTGSTTYRCTVSRLNTEVEFNSNDATNSVTVSFDHSILAPGKTVHIKCRDLPVVLAEFTTSRIRYNLKYFLPTSILAVAFSGALVAPPVSAAEFSDVSITYGAPYPDVLSTFNISFGLLTQPISTGVVVIALPSPSPFALGSDVTEVSEDLQIFADGESLTTIIISATINTVLGTITIQFDDADLPAFTHIVLRWNSPIRISGKRDVSTMPYTVESTSSGLGSSLKKLFIYGRGVSSFGAITPAFGTVSVSSDKTSPLTFRGGLLNNNNVDFIVVSDITIAMDFVISIPITGANGAADWTFKQCDTNSNFARRISDDDKFSLLVAKREIPRGERVVINCNVHITKPSSTAIKRDIMMKGNEFVHATGVFATQAVVPGGQLSIMPSGVTALTVGVPGVFAFTPSIVFPMLDAVDDDTKVEIKLKFADPRVSVVDSAVFVCKITLPDTHAFENVTDTVIELPTVFTAGSAPALTVTVPVRKYLTEDVRNAVKCDQMVFDVAVPATALNGIAATFTNTQSNRVIASTDSLSWNTVNGYAKTLSVLSPNVVVSPIIYTTKNILGYNITRYNHSSLTYEANFGSNFTALRQGDHVEFRLEQVEIVPASSITTRLTANSVELVRVSVGSDSPPLITFLVPVDVATVNGTVVFNIFDFVASSGNSPSLDEHLVGRAKYGHARYASLDYNGAFITDYDTIAEGVPFTAESVSIISNTFDLEFGVDGADTATLTANVYYPITIHRATNQIASFEIGLQYTAATRQSMGYAPYVELFENVAGTNASLRTCVLNDQPELGSFTWKVTITPSSQASLVVSPTNPSSTLPTFVGAGTDVGSRVKFVCNNIPTPVDRIFGVRPNVGAIKNARRCRNRLTTDLCSGASDPDIIFNHAQSHIHSINIPRIGDRVHSITPANVTAGSDFGLLTVAVSPVSVDIPVNSFMRVKLPLSWSISPSLTCVASTRSSIPDKAEYPLKAVFSPYPDTVSFNKARSWGAVAEGSDARWFEVTFLTDVPATDATLSIMCNNVKVSATVENNSEIDQAIEFYDAKHRRLADTVHSIFPNIVKFAAKPTTIVQSFVLSRNTPLSDAEIAITIAAIAAVHQVPVASVIITRQALAYSASATTDVDNRITSSSEDSLATLTVTYTVKPKQTLATEAESAVASSTAAVAAAVSKTARTPVLQMSAVKSFTIDASCTDGVMNNSETDADCGGGSCPACKNGSSCAANTDCVSGNCSDNLCTSHQNAAAGSATVGAAVMAAIIAAVLGMML